MAAQRPLVDFFQRQWLPAAVVLATALLAAVNWMQDPEQARRWLRAMLMPPAALLAVMLWIAWLGRTRRTGAADDPARWRYFEAALMLTALAVGIRPIAALSVEIWVRIGDHAADLDAERRVLGLAAAATFLVIGNAVPKILTPLSILPLPLAERVTRARRFLGTLLVALGVTMAIGYVATPLMLARAFAGWARLAALLALAGAIVWMNLPAPETGHDE
jgi:hypothetical protein